MARTKGIQVYPDANGFIKQANQLARMAYSLPGTQRGILAVLISQVQVRKNGFELLEVAAGDMARALGIAPGNNDWLREHMKALRGQTLGQEHPDGSWKVFGWVDTIEFVKSRDVFKFRLSPDLLPFILDLKAQWALIQIADLNKLTGKYSHRIYDQVMSASGFEGQGGNKPGEWFVDLDFADLRVLFRIEEGEYKRTESFRRVVIDNPVRQINEANIGIHLAADYDRFRRGRTLSGVRLLVKSTLPGEPRNVTPSPQEDEEAALIAINQDLYNRLLREEPEDMFGGELARQGNAYQALLKHPDLKPLPKKRGRKVAK